MSDIERLTQAISRLIAMDFSSTPMAEPWSDSMRPLAQAIEVLARTMQRETVASAHASSLRKVCQSIVQKRGAASGF